MFRVKLIGLFALLLLLTLPTASATPNYSPNPWGISFQPFVLYVDSGGALVGVEYNYHEEAGHFSNGVLKSVEPWAYFVFYVNQTGAYYVDFMAFSGYEFPLFTFYKGWFYLFLLTSTNTSFPMRDSGVSNTVTVIRYRDGVIQKLGEVPWWVVGSMNVSMPYFLITKPELKGEERFLYKIDDSVKLVSTGENLTLKCKQCNPTHYLTLFKNSTSFPLVYRDCLIPKVESNYVQFIPSHYRLPLKELSQKFEPVNRSCAIFFNDGLLIIPPSIGVGFANGSMWVQRGSPYMWQASIIVYPFKKGVLQKPLNVSLYLYKKGVWKELPLLQVSKKGAAVLAPPVRYVETVPKAWYRTQRGFFILLVFAAFGLMFMTWRFGVLR